MKAPCGVRAGSTTNTDVLDRRPAVGLFTALAAAAVDSERQRFLDEMRILVPTTLETDQWHNTAVGRK